MASEFIDEYHHIFSPIILILVIYLIYKQSCTHAILKKTEGFMTGADLALRAGSIRDDTGARDSIGLRSQGGESSIPPVPMEYDYAWMPKEQTKSGFAPGFDAKYLPDYITGQ